MQHEMETLSGPSQTQISVGLNLGSRKNKPTPQFSFRGAHAKEPFRGPFCEHSSLPFHRAFAALCPVFSFRAACRTTPLTSFGFTLLKLPTGVCEIMALRNLGFGPSCFEHTGLPFEPRNEAPTSEDQEIRLGNLNGVRLLCLGRRLASVRFPAPSLASRGYGLGDDPSHHQFRRLDEVGAPSGEVSLPHMERPSVASLKARSCHGCPAIVAEHGINTRIVLLFYDPHVECHWSCVGDCPSPARFGWPGLVANVCAADQFGWDILQRVRALAVSESPVNITSVSKKVHHPATIQGSEPSSIPEHPKRELPDVASRVTLARLRQDPFLHGGRRIPGDAHSK